MKIVVIIPSRYGSTRFAGKPLAMISGKPMIQCVYERAAGAEMVDAVVVATDDRRIFSAVTGFGGKAIMTSAENRSGTDRVAEAAEKLNLSADDIVVNIQGDQPRIHPSCIREVAAPLIENPDIQMSTLAFRIVNPEEIMTEGTPAPIPATSFRMTASMAQNMSSRTSRSEPWLLTTTDRRSASRPPSTRPARTFVPPRSTPITAGSLMPPLYSSSWRSSRWR